MGSISKLIAAVVGNLIGILAAWLAVNAPMLASCDASNVCTVLGLSQIELTGAIMVLVNAAFVYWSPANKT